MQIGEITVDGRLIGTVSLITGSDPDTLAPISGFASEAPDHGGHSGGHHYVGHSHGRDEGHGAHLRNHSKKLREEDRGPVTLGKGDDPRGMEGHIRAEAKNNNVDPDTAVRVAKSEGLRDRVGDQGTSFGAFQLHKHGGLGDEFQKETGLDPADPANEKATISWALKNVGRTGWEPYHGAARVGVGHWDGVNGNPATSSEADPVTNLMSGAPLSSRDAVSVRTAGGNAFRANPESAPYLQGFVEDLEKAGAPISNIGGHNIRTIAGSNRWSQHAYGNAIDIEQHSRNVVSPPFEKWSQSHPQEMRNALNKWGIVSGGDWRNPDYGHFEWGGTRPAQTAPTEAIAPPSMGPASEHHSSLDAPYKVASADPRSESGHDPNYAIEERKFEPGERYLKSPNAPDPTGRYPDTISDFNLKYHRDPVSDEELEFYMDGQPSGRSGPLEIRGNKPPPTVYPPTPGDSSDPARTGKPDQFSIPSDYDLG